jgi:tellurite resistance-related uncharacterized protein
MKRLPFAKLHVTQAQQVMTADHNAPACSPPQQLHRIVAEAGYFSAIA